jgi:hypothetical protein
VGHRPSGRTAWGKKKPWEGDDRIKYREGNKVKGIKVIFCSYPSCEAVLPDESKETAQLHRQTCLCEAKNQKTSFIGKARLCQIGPKYILCLDTW